MRSVVAAIAVDIRSAAHSWAEYALRHWCRAGFVARVVAAIAVAMTATMCSYWAQSSGRPVASLAAPSGVGRQQTTDKTDRLDAFVREARAVSGLGDALTTSDASPLVQWPLANRITTGVRIGPHGERAYGIRIALPVGTPVRAAADGVVDFAGNGSDGYGKKVIIKHGAIETIYAHVSEILGKKNDKVRKGQVIAKSGQTGFATTPRLYLGILGGGTSVDPISFFNKGGTLGQCAPGNAACKARETAAKTAAAPRQDRRPVPPSDVPTVRIERAANL